ncbi:MAG: hypothetical protein ABI380_08655 [Edaphobacter sp.]
MREASWRSGEGRGGTLVVDGAGGERVEDHRERELDRFGVFERQRFEVLGGHEGAAPGFGKTESAMTVMEAVVEVAPRLAGQRGRATVGSVSPDMTA